MEPNTKLPAAHHPGEHHVHATVHLPAPTAWPILLALGFTLIFASLVTSAGLAYLGLLIVVASIIGWFREVLPHEHHVDIPVEVEIFEVEAGRRSVTRIEVDETHRAQLPLQTFTWASGLKGGIAGGIAMVIPAEIYGIVRFHSLWYVVNLLGGAGVGDWTDPTMYQLTHFRLSAFITANIIQGVTTLLVGILYGALLPLWPKRPILLGGILAPVLWTGLLYGALNIVNPYLRGKIDWWSFAVSQVFFGVVAGYTVSRLGNLKRLAQIPLSMRLGVESPGLHAERQEQDQESKS
jgi:hypothetical protein